LKKVLLPYHEYGCLIHTRDLHGKFSPGIPQEIPRVRE